MTTRPSPLKISFFQNGRLFPRQVVAQILSPDSATYLIAGVRVQVSSAARHGRNLTDSRFKQRVVLDRQAGKPDDFQVWPKPRTNTVDSSGLVKLLSTNDYAPASIRRFWPGRRLREGSSIGACSFFHPHSPMKCRVAEITSDSNPWPPPR
jgi:hypothetical protein